MIDRFFDISRFIKKPSDICLLYIEDQIKRSNQVPFIDRRRKVKNNIDIILDVRQFKVCLGHIKIDVSQLYYLFVANIAPEGSWVSYYYCVHISDSILIPDLIFK